MSRVTTVNVPIGGMDCAECTQHVRRAIAGLPGVEEVAVYLAAEKAVVRLDPERVNLVTITRAVEGAGYSVTGAAGAAPETRLAAMGDFTRPILTLFGIVFGIVLFVVVAGEWLGLFESVTRRLPLPVGAGIVLVAGYPVFRNVIRAALHRQVISHTLMSLGVLAALAVGQWATAVVVVFFMRVGDYAEHYTTERARRAVKDLTELAPRLARVERGGIEQEVPVNQVQPGETVVVRPGEQIPVDGDVIDGQATVDQALLTGEAMPLEAGPGAQVLAASMAQLGSLRVRASRVGRDTAFGRAITMVEEAEAHRADVQRIADRFSAYYLPIVAGIGALTLLLRRDPLAAAAVLVVACSCSFALATPIAMLASIGAGARRGLLIKGGKYLELLARADVLLVDKTGTLTLGRPQLVDVRSLDGRPDEEILALAATAERYSEHPLANAVRSAAAERGLTPGEPRDFEALPGLGVRCRVDGCLVEVGTRRLLGEHDLSARAAVSLTELEAQGKTLMLVVCDRQIAGVLAAMDTLRPEVPGALAEVRALGVRRIELLTGDNELSAAGLAQQLGVAFRAGLLPEDKIAIVRQYQAEGHTVIMVGDGVNDAPALAQADVGVAIGVGGSSVASEAAHVALMRDDWSLVPELLRIARRTLRVVKSNIAFTGVYNVLGLSLAALGFLPPIFAAAAQSLPDIGILANSSRLLRQR